ncbi:GNAT family N-acetyltransferase [Streptomyces sp. SID8379]|uniref:GNAT family N-acetyltransferase n=1 Tax=unclassified Streptomyces TaxID=2593676 RepID=UPI00037A212C|nr:MULTISPECIES: GNAT family N-acetyltransferase [unclassified Streptomyces]MYW63766.1 GNAT family N-acetyltransferase [Streptomyces sp. SID8379]
MAEVYLRRLTRWQAEQQREAFADVYVSAYHGAAGAEYRDRIGFLRRFEQHVRHDGFDMTVADAPDLVGCAYGFRLERDGAWWADFPVEVTSQTEELTASGRVFALTELMVLPEHRRSGVATRLGDLLLSRHSQDLVVAGVDERRCSAGIRELLRAWGWKELPVTGPVAEVRGREVWARGPVR